MCPSITSNEFYYYIWWHVGFQSEKPTRLSMLLDDKHLLSVLIISKVHSLSKHDTPRTIVGMPSSDCVYTSDQRSSIIQ